MIDRLAGAVLAAALAPVLAVVAVVVRACDGRPVLFAHERAGLGGRPFRVFKFRTMRAARHVGEPDETRITPVGRVLRRSSLDELPSLWNVIRGDMNLVGPRPLPMAYNAAYTPEQARRLEVKPGLTGPVQVQGRNSLTWEQKFALDIWYVEHRSWRVDVALLLRTPLAVLTGRGISHAGHATMPIFSGEAQA
ncbi:MAG TPA: sugar transferase [Acidimicrobiales bacterium]|nr:sugar transferase [Acidimicrobiales bacterium]